MKVFEPANGTGRSQVMTSVLSILVVLVVGSACGSKSSAPKKEQDGSGSVEPVRAAGTVVLTLEQERNARLKLGKVEQRSAAGLLATTAQLQASSNGVARVSPRLSGRVTTVKAEVGQTVTAGQALAIIDAPDLGRAKADYLAALALANVARESADREKVLHDKQISSERDWREAEAQAIRTRTEKEAAENRLHTLGLSDPDLARLNPSSHYGSTMSVTAPIDGVVVERTASVGMMVEPQSPMFVVMDVREIWVLMDVYEQDLPQIKVGQKVVAHVDAYRDKSFAGEVGSIGAIVEPATRAVKVRVVLPNPAGELKPGMFATVEVAGTKMAGHDGLYLPSSAVQRDGDQKIVFVKRGERQFQRRIVKLGRDLGDWTEVVEGLTAGTDVVTDGSFVLKAELKKAELGGDD
jgi:cobalt-zinc-cadmium efflux system membrane fusion protein